MTTVSLYFASPQMYRFGYMYFHITVFSITLIVFICLFYVPIVQKIFQILEMCDLITRLTFQMRYLINILLKTIIVIHDYG